MEYVNSVTEKISTVTSMVAKMLQKSKFLLYVLYLCYIKFYFRYILYIYVIYFTIYLLHIYMHIICFFNFGYIFLFSYCLILNLCDNVFIFIICTKLLWSKTHYKKDICISLIGFFDDIWNFLLYGFHTLLHW